MAARKVQRACNGKRGGGSCKYEGERGGGGGGEGESLGARGQGRHILLLKRHAG